VKHTFLIIGLFLPLIGSVVYIHSILSGKSRPHRMTRLLILLISGLSFGALFAGHDTSGIWLALVSMLQAMVIWAMALKRGMGGREPLDLICFGLCILGLALWLVSGQSLLGLVMSIAADLVACVPALWKTVRLPHTELVWFYLIDTVAALFIALASAHTPAALLYPLYIMLINGVFAVVISWPRPAEAAVIARR
jgi:hypothetical protein